VAAAAVRQLGLHDLQRLFPFEALQPENWRLTSTRRGQPAGAVGPQDDVGLHSSAPDVVRTKLEHATLPAKAIDEVTDLELIVFDVFDYGVTSIFGFLCTLSNCKALICFMSPSSHSWIERGARAPRQLAEFIHCAPPLTYVLIRILKSPRIAHLVGYFARSTPTLSS
jgi:hypothetical protein